MPFKSEAQRKFMFAEEARGGLSKGTAERWAHETPNIKNLPKRVKSKKKKVKTTGQKFSREAIVGLNKRLHAA